MWKMPRSGPPCPPNVEFSTFFFFFDGFPNVKSISARTGGGAHLVATGGARGGRPGEEVAPDADQRPRPAAVHDGGYCSR